MSAKRSKRKNKSSDIWLSIIVIVITSILCGIFYFVTDLGSDNEDTSSSDIIQSDNTKNLSIEYIDVAQADSSLITLPNGKIMLIDAGGNATANELSDYISSKGITKIDYLIGTHPHEDHIGGLDVVIKNFDIVNIYLPVVDESDVPTTKTYNDVLDAISDKKLKVNKGTAGTVILNEDNLKAEIIAPNSENYSELNDYSIVIRLTYGSKSFLFMGDAEELSENEIIDNNYTVTADVIKCGHHGSNSSSSEAFIDEVNPKYAIISCGEDNKYGHPHKETIELFESKGIEYYRTDIQGNIYLTCDGKNITINTEK